MSNNFEVPHPETEPSGEPNELSIGELADLTSSKRSAAQYETRIKHLREEVAMYRGKADGLQDDLNAELIFLSLIHI